MLYGRTMESIMEYNNNVANAYQASLSICLPAVQVS